jgi:exonuclease VII small subunit
MFRAKEETGLEFKGTVYNEDKIVSMIEQLTLQLDALNERLEQAMQNLYIAKGVLEEIEKQNDKIE